MGEPSTSHLSPDGMPALTSMGIDRADIRCEGPLVVIASSWTKHRRRWFVSDGYHVAFYKTRELTVRRGRFDLRIVLHQYTLINIDSIRGQLQRLLEESSGS